MADEGCTWNHDLQRCDIDITKDRDGNPFRDAVGCMKCGDLGKDSCNLLENCYWDKKKCKSCNLKCDYLYLDYEYCLYCVTTFKSIKTSLTKV